MSYSKHNFIPGDVLQAKPLNEMDNQIYENAKKISDINHKLIFYANNSGKNTLVDSDNGRIQDMIIYGRSVQDGIPTPEAPVEIHSVGDGGSVSVTVCGKNLIDDAPAQGVTIGSTETRVHNISGVTYVPAGIYVLSCVFQDGTNSNDTIYLNLRNKNNTVVKAFRCGVPLQFDSGISVNSMDIYANSAQSGKTIKSVQLERGSTPTDYEPYTETTATVSTPNGLPGIPVTSGGNYTDANGQQWICDEVDFARGVYVKRVNKLRITETGGVQSISETYVRCQASVPRANNYYSSKAMNTLFPYSDDYTGEFAHAYVWSNLIYWFLPKETVRNAAEANAWLSDNDFRFAYVLETPIETQIPEDELAAYAALHTYYPTTNVFVTSEQLENFVSFFYPVFVTEGFRYVRKQIEDNLLHITELKKDLSSLITRLQSGSIENAELHLGFYLDESGDLCQKEE